jgi:hypothetical protein
MEWNSSCEKILQKYGDEAQTRASMHRLHYYSYKKLTTWFQIPLVIGSALSGSVQFLSSSFPAIEKHIITATASLSIIVSIASAIMSYLKLPESMANHKVSLIEWQAFYNKISHQLGLRKKDRIEPESFMEEVKTQYLRLFEISPICNQGFITATKKKIRKNATTEFTIPHYLNGFVHTKIWVEEDEKYEDNSVSQ